MSGPHIASRFGGRTRHETRFMMLAILWTVLSLASEADTALYAQAPSPHPDSLQPGIRLRIRSSAGREVIGTLLGAWPGDSLTLLTLRRAAGHAESSVSIPWGQIRQVDRAVGTNALKGALIGLGASTALGLFFAVTKGGETDLSRAEIFIFGGVTAVITVPIGAVIGGSSTRWKRTAVSR